MLDRSQLHRFGTEVIHDLRDEVGFGYVVLRRGKKFSWLWDDGDMNVGPMTSRTTFATVEDALRDALSDWDLQGVPDGENGNYGLPIRELLGAQTVGPR
jgi:hypothetical protein